MSTPQPPKREKESVDAVPPQREVESVSGPDGDSSGDQDIDTAGTEADAESPKAADFHDRSPARPVIDRHR